MVTITIMMLTLMMVAMRMALMFGWGTLFNVQRGPLCFVLLILSEGNVFICLICG